MIPGANEQLFVCRFWTDDNPLNRGTAPVANQRFANTIRKLNLCQKAKATTDLNVCPRTRTHAHFHTKITASSHANRWQLYSPNLPLKNQATSPTNENASTLRTGRFTQQEIPVMAKCKPYIATSPTKPETRWALLLVGIEFQSDAREFSDAPAPADNAHSNSALHTRRSTSQTARRKTRCSQHSLHVFVDLTSRRMPNTGK